jgi:hypothetical protein
VNTPYHAVILGRESARLLANLSQTFANKVIISLGEDNLRHWMDSVDSLQDIFLKQQAMRARMLLKVSYSIN